MLVVRKVRADHDSGKNPAGRGKRSISGAFEAIGDIVVR
jgi:hypothetical protein